MALIFKVFYRPSLQLLCVLFVVGAQLNFQAQLTGGFMKLFSLLALTFVLFTGVAHANSSQANFDTCVNNDESWYRRWGQYVVSFDRRDADQKCREQYPFDNVNPTETGCYSNGSWIAAGYYCNVEYSGGDKAAE